MPTVPASRIHAVGGKTRPMVTLLLMLLLVLSPLLIPVLVTVVHAVRR